MQFQTDLSAINVTISDAFSLHVGVTVGCRVGNFNYRHRLILSNLP